MSHDFNNFILQVVRGPIDFFVTTSHLFGCAFTGWETYLSQNVYCCHDSLGQLAFVFHSECWASLLVVVAITCSWCCSLFMQMVTAILCWLKPSVLVSPRRFLVSQGVVFLFINDSIKSKYKVTLLVHKPRNKSYVSSAVCEINLIEWKFLCVFFYNEWH